MNGIITMLEKGLEEEKQRLRDYKKYLANDAGIDGSPALEAHIAVCKAKIIDYQSALKVLKQDQKSVLKCQIAEIQKSLKRDVAPFTAAESDKVQQARYPEDFTQYYPNSDAPHAHNVVVNIIKELDRIHKKL